MDPTSFYKFSRCIYTAQGDVVCENNTFYETFVQEKANIAQENDANNVFVSDALRKEYCDISVETDPKTGKTVYSFRKECNK